MDRGEMRDYNSFKVQLGLNRVIKGREEFQDFYFKQKWFLGMGFVLVLYRVKELRFCDGDYFGLYVCYMCVYVCE